MDPSQWNWFLTPSTTPTDATFSPATVQTPRSTSHFQDAFSPYIHHHTSSTPFVNADQVDGKTFGQRDSGLHIGPDTDQVAHANKMHKTPFGYHEMSEQSVGQNDKHTGAAIFQTVQQQVNMHTPPPTTRTNPEKRRVARPHSIMFGAPSSMDQVMSGQSMPLIDHSQVGMLSHSTSQPLLPMAMDFSQVPNMMSGQPSQDDTFWSFSNAMSLNDPSHQAGHTLADPFTYQAQASVVPSHDDAQFLATTSQLFTPVQPTPLQRVPVVPSNSQKPLPHLPAENMPNMMRSNGALDPTFLYSSPNRMLPPTSVPHQAFLPSQPATHKDSFSPERTPHMPVPSAAASLAASHLSMQSEREGSRPPSSGGLRSGLRRSNTTETRRPHSMYGSIDSLSRSNTTTGIQRRASPLKRYNRNSTTSLASISEASTNLPRSRTSVVLTIDSMGRARTETRPIEPSPSKDMRSRYPNLWDDSDSDTDSDETASTSNKRNSLQSRPEDRRRAKLDSTLESLEGLHLPRSSSSASNHVTPSKAAIAAAVQLRRQSSAKKSYAHTRRNTAASIDQDAMDTNSDSETNGDATAALRKAMERRDQHREQAAARQQARSRPQSMTARPPQPAFPPRSSSLANLDQLTFDTAVLPQQPQQQPQPHQHHQQHHSMSFLPTSPMKPSGSFADAMSSLTRCICQLPIADNQLMIQCNSCQLWLHTLCLGIPADNVPSVYFCTYCMVGAGFGPQGAQQQVPTQVRGGEWEAQAAF